MRRWCSGMPSWSMPVWEMDMRVGVKYRCRSDDGSMELSYKNRDSLLVEECRG
jgi:hypothetical protein